MIKVLLAGDEEVLHANSNANDVLIEESRGYMAAFNTETGFVDNGIVVGRKGVARLMGVKGIAAHAGNDPENGRSAILEMAHKIIAVQNLTDWEKGVSFNVGGGSDSAYTVLAGVPTVCAMGVKGGRNHSPEEYAVVETLFERAKLLIACVLKMESA